MKVSGPVPVLLAGGEVDDVSGSDLDHLFAFLLRPPDAGDDVQDLALRVRVPVGARPALEEHAEDPSTGW